MLIGTLVIFGVKRETDSVSVDTRHIKLHSADTAECPVGEAVLCDGNKIYPLTVSGETGEYRRVTGYSTLLGKPVNAMERYS